MHSRALLQMSDFSQKIYIYILGQDSEFYPYLKHHPALRICKATDVSYWARIFIEGKLLIIEIFLFEIQSLNDYI